MKEQTIIHYKGNTYPSLRHITDPSLAFYNTRRIREALHEDLPLGADIVARPMEGLTFLAWNGATLMPAKKTFDMAVAVACALDSVDRHVVVGDIGTGTGVFPITVASLLDGKSSYFATDISGKALETANINAQINGLPEGKITWKRTDCMRGLSQEAPGFDVIFSNPPFSRTADLPRVNRSRFNPDLALDGGSDGAMYYRQFALEAVPMLNKDGVLIFQLPLEEEGVEQAVRTVYPLFPALPIHLLSDTGRRYKQHFPLFMTLGGSPQFIQQLQAQHYHAERV